MKLDVQDPNPQTILAPTPINRLVESIPEPAGVVSWSPPQPNWNPWTGCNIDEGPLASASLEDLSEQLSNQQRDMMQNSTLLAVIHFIYNSYCIFVYHYMFTFYL